MSVITPIDRVQCQAEKPNTKYNPLGFGPEYMKRMVRCTNTPTTIASEVTPGTDGERGKMSLCDDCVAVAKVQLPAGFCVFRPIRKVNPAKLSRALPSGNHG